MALLGENGAGKTTNLCILAGIYEASSGALGPSSTLPSARSIPLISSALATCPRTSTFLFTGPSSSSSTTSSPSTRSGTTLFARTSFRISSSPEIVSSPPCPGGGAVP
ncbi:hypothetical protein N9B06_00110 [bacterium]|nr:hypothetical protein [bacterium]